MAPRCISPVQKQCMASAMVLCLFFWESSFRSLSVSGMGIFLVVRTFSIRGTSFSMVQILPCLGMMSDSVLSKNLMTW